MGTSWMRLICCCHLQKDKLADHVSHKFHATLCSCRPDMVSGKVLGRQRYSTRRYANCFKVIIRMKKWKMFRWKNFAVTIKTTKISTSYLQIYIHIVFSNSWCICTTAFYMYVRMIKALLHVVMYSAKPWPFLSITVAVVIVTSDICRVTLWTRFSPMD